MRVSSSAGWRQRGKWSLSWYILKAERERKREEDERIYETIRLLTPKTLSSASCVPLHYMLQAPW